MEGLSATGTVLKARAVAAGQRAEAELRFRGLMRSDEGWSSWRVLLRIVFVLLSLTFGLTALGLFVLSGHYLSQASHFAPFLSAKMLAGPGARLALVGLLFIVLSFLSGYEGLTKKAGACVHVTLATILAALWILLVSSAAVFAFYNARVPDVLAHRSASLLQTYGTNASVTDAELDYAQAYLGCCGMKSYADWKNAQIPFASVHPHSVPASCCKRRPCALTNGAIHLNLIGHNDIYTGGCLKALEELFTANLGYVVGLTATFAVLLSLGFFGAIALVCIHRRRQRLQAGLRYGHIAEANPYYDHPVLNAVQDDFRQTRKDDEDSDDDSLFDRT